MTTTQADRDAAGCVAVLCGWSGTIIRDMLNGTCEAIRHEYEQQVAFIEAFAAHREAAEARAKLEGAKAMQEAAAAVADERASDDPDEYEDGIEAAECIAHDIRALDPAQIAGCGK